MSLPVALRSRLSLPLIAAPMFLVSGPALTDSKAVLKLEQQLLAELQI